MTYRPSTRIVSRRSCRRKSKVTSTRKRSTSSVQVLAGPKNAEIWLSNISPTFKPHGTGITCTDGNIPRAECVPTDTDVIEIRQEPPYEKRRIAAALHQRAVCILIKQKSTRMFPGCDQHPRNDADLPQNLTRDVSASLTLTMHSALLPSMQLTPALCLETISRSLELSHSFALWPAKHDEHYNFHREKTSFN